MADSTLFGLGIFLTIIGACVAVWGLLEGRRTRWPKPQPRAPKSPTNWAPRDWPPRHTPTPRADQSTKFEPPYDNFFTGLIAGGTIITDSAQDTTPDTPVFQGFDGGSSGGAGASDSWGCDASSTTADVSSTDCNTDNNLGGN